jgi:hypothetical protein
MLPTRVCQTVGAETTVLMSNTSSLPDSWESQLTNDAFDVGMDSIHTFVSLLQFRESRATTRLPDVPTCGLCFVSLALTRRRTPWSLATTLGPSRRWQTATQRAH